MTKPKQNTKYYTTLMHAGAQEGLYVNDTDALANRQFHNRFDGAFVRWTSSPSSSLDEVVNRQALFKKAFEIARDPKKRKFVDSLSAYFSSEPFSERGVIYGEKDSFWDEYASLLGFLNGEEELPPQMEMLKRELAKNLPARKREGELLDAIDDKIKESVNSMGIFWYNVEFEGGCTQNVKSAGEERVTFSFNLYPRKAGGTSMENMPKELEKRVVDQLKLYARDIVRNIMGSEEMADALMRSKGKALLSVSYTYNEDGFRTDIAVEDVSVDSSPNLPEGNSKVLARFMDRQEQEIAYRYGRDTGEPRREVKGWLIKKAALAACYGVADFCRWIWNSLPVSAEYDKRSMRQSAKEQYDRFFSEFTDALSEKQRNLIAAKMQAAIGDALASPDKSEGDMRNKYRKAETLAEELKNTTAEMAIAHFGDDIREALSHRGQYANIVCELKGLVSIAEKYLEIEKQGLPLCFPRFRQGERKSVSAKGLYPIRLIAAGNRVSDVVPNDVELNGRPMVITGENGGGKSIYLYSIADMIVQAQTGLPVLAEDAEMSVVGGVYLHFVKPGDIQQGESRFINEVERLKNIVERVGPDDVALFDELGSGTDLEGALYVSGMVADNMARNRVSTVLVTHLGEFAQKSKDKGYNVVKTGGGFKFEPGIGSSKGKHVAMKRGLTQEFFDKAMNKGGK